MASAHVPNLACTSNELAYRKILAEYLASLDKPDWPDKYNFFAQQLATLAPENAWQIQMVEYTKKIGTPLNQILGY